MSTGHTDMVIDWTMIHGHSTNFKHFYGSIYFTIFNESMISYQKERIPGHKKKKNPVRQSFHHFMVN